MPTTAGSKSAPAMARAVPLHIPSLDGLRAISFLIVYLAHSGVRTPLAGIPGGFGVTVFFFLSGYLITTLLRVEREASGAINIKHFYLRRVLRILPPFYTILLLASILTLAGVLPGELRLAPLAAQAGHIANYWFIFVGTAGTPAGTVPYWSLAVEEHFYLIFPLLYIWLTRSLPRRRQAIMLWTFCGVVCLWRCLLVFGFGAIEDRTYMASDTRFDSILFGCALAAGCNPVLDGPVGHERLWKYVLLPMGLGILLLTFLYRAPWFRETLRYTLQGIALTPIFVTAIRFPRWLPMRVLNAAPVAWVGGLSYTLYLAHQVVLFGLEYWLPGATKGAVAMLALAISLLVALLVQRWIERPAAKLRQRLMRVAPAATAVR